MNKQSVALALKGYSRRELPGWGWVLRRAGVFDDSVWREAPTAVAEGKLHGFRMELDLRNWSERQTYFLGRFYDLPTQLLVMRLLRRGDLFVDVGANIGMISALAARCVGPEGRVLAFEPNPDAMRRLRRLIETNDLAERIEALSSALSDAEGTMTLSVITEHTGMGTLSEVPPEQRGLVSGTHAVDFIAGHEGHDHDLGLEEDEHANHNDTWYMGFGARLRFSGSGYITGEYTPRLHGYDPNASEWGVAVEKRTGGHTLQLNFTNSFATTLGQLARGGNPHDVYLGFNITRRF